MNVLIDSNIVIYSASKNAVELRKWLAKQALFVSLITRLEVLGYHKISEGEIELTEKLFTYCQLISIDTSIIDQAIKFRQLKSMSIGDAIIAATAFELRLPIVTGNTKDFEHIPDLKVINPLEF